MYVTSSNPSCTGKLVIVPTPIGNLGDMTPRAMEALKSADVVCAEDTRVTGKLLSAFGISKRLERLDENIISKSLDSFIARVARGEIIAYCSDAGMPGVSDPGLRLVAAFHQQELPVEVLPGASAVTTAYVLSGFTCPRFYFGGFFPRKKGERVAILQSLRDLDAVIIFYESPNRIIEAVTAVGMTIPERQIAVCRELTKMYEQVIKGDPSDVVKFFSEEGKDLLRGEMVLVIDAPPAKEAVILTPEILVGAMIRATELLKSGKTKRETNLIIREEFGLSRNDAYDITAILKVDK